MPRLHFSKLIAISALGLAASASSGMADLYWAGTTGDATTAGAGDWNNDPSNLDWSTAPSGTSNATSWADNGNAVFAGSGGGMVNGVDALNVSSATFTGSGSFNISNDDLMIFTGAGLANNSGVTQTLTNNGEVDLNNSASASGGSSALTISNNSAIILSNNATLGSAVVDNYGTVGFNGTTHGGTASITNEDGGSVDLSSLTSTGLAAAALNNSGSVTLGTKNLTVDSLTIQDSTTNGDGFRFTLDSTNGEVVVNTNYSASGVTDIYVSTGGAFASLASYTLIDDLGTGSPMDLSNYALQAGGPSNYELRVNGSELDLVAVPEVSSFALPLMLGAAGFFWLQRRRGMLSLPAMQA